MYDAALWKFFKKGTMGRFHSCYNKCVKAFFGYKRHDSLSKDTHTYLLIFTLTSKFIIFIYKTLFPFLIILFICTL